MALTFAQSTSGDAATSVALASGWYLIVGTLTFSGSYSTGGETLDLSKYIGGGGTMRHVIALADVRGYAAEYDRTNKKLKLWVPNPTGPAVAEHGAAAYDTDLTGSAMDCAFLVKMT